MQRSWGQFIHADELESATRYQMNKFPLFRSGEGLRESRYEIREDGDYVEYKKLITTQKRVVLKTDRLFELLRLFKLVLQLTHLLLSCKHAFEPRPRPCARRDPSLLHALQP